MMVGDGRHPGLREKFSQGNAQGNMHGNGQAVLRYDDIDSKFFNKPVEGTF